MPHSGSAASPGLATSPLTANTPATSKLTTTLMSPSPALVPVLVVGGFLGSGKTSFLKHVLQNNEGLKVAVMRNEFSPEAENDLQLDFEEPLLIRSEDTESYRNFVQLPNSCVCCTAKCQLLQGLSALLRSASSAFDLAILEVAGVADVAVVAENLINGIDPEEDLFRLLGTLVMHDATLTDSLMPLIAPLLPTLNDDVVTRSDDNQLPPELASRLLEINAPEIGAPRELAPNAFLENEGNPGPASLLPPIQELIVAQLGAADVVALNKMDLLPADVRDHHQEKMEVLLAALNPACKLFVTSFSALPVSQVIEGIKQASSSSTTFPPFSPQPTKRGEREQTANRSLASPLHACFRNLVIEEPPENEYDLAAFEEAVKWWLWEDDETRRIFRFKGLLRSSEPSLEGEQTTWVFREFQGVRQSLESSKLEVGKERLSRMGNRLLVVLIANQVEVDDKRRELEGILHRCRLFKIRPIYP